MFNGLGYFLLSNLASSVSSITNLSMPLTSEYSSLSSTAKLLHISSVSVFLECLDKD